MAPKRGKTYRTSSGKQVDFGALLLANETAPALGNMNVNARGDEIAPDGSITKSREQIMREYNELNTMVPSDDSIPEGTNVATADDDWQDWEPILSPDQFNNKAQKAETVADQVEENPDRVIDKTAKTPSGGLAAAVAAAKKVDQTVQPAKGTEEREQEGVRRI
tara:strand:+ start:576 stop:1067 length:492 start_codon:yes stop_codon:yes gene_type:complete